MAEENPRYPANQEDLSSGKAPVCSQAGSLEAQCSLLEAVFMDMRIRIVQWPQFWLSSLCFPPNIPDTLKTEMCKCCGESEM